MDVYIVNRQTGRAISDRANAGTSISSVIRQYDAMRITIVTDDSEAASRIGFEPLFVCNGDG